MPSNDEVNLPVQAWLAVQPEWELITALLGGTQAMRKAGPRFLPREQAEQEDLYRTRIERSFLFGAFDRTVRSLASRPFRKPVQLEDDVPGIIISHAENIDFRGNNLTIFAAHVFETFLAYGSAHFLVDMPTLPTGATLADAIAVSARPYWCHVHPLALIGWRVETYSGVPRLTQVRIRETVVEPEGTFGETILRQVRVLSPGLADVWRETEKGEWFLYSSAPTSLDTIPLCSLVWGETTDVMIGKPPLMNLAWLNQEHWQSSSDQRHVLHIARVPIMVASGFEEGDDGPLVVSPDSLIRTSNPSAKIVYVEHTGAAINAGRQDLVDLEQRMATLGLELLSTKPGDVTATQSIIEASTADSPLGLMIAKLGDAIERGLGFTAAWLGMPEGAGGSVVLHKDLPDPTSNTAEEAMLRMLRNDREITQTTMLTGMKERGLFPDDFDVEEEVAATEQEANLEMQALIAARQTANAAAQQDGAASQQTPQQESGIMARQGTNSQTSSQAAGA